MAKTEGYKGTRGAALVDDEPDLLRSVPIRQRPQRDTLPEDFSSQYSPRRPVDPSSDVRVRRRAAARKGRIPAWMKTRWGRVVLALALIAIAGAAVAAALAVRSFFEHDPRFRIATSDFIQTTGNNQLTRDQLLSVFGADIGRNIFFVPLARRRAELEQIPWVERATVMRILPNQLRVAVRERTPVAFVRVGNRIKLVDAAGVILDMPPAMMAARHFSFPVVSGVNPADPLSVRAARMALYRSFITAIDSTGQRLSANISEVNLSDPEDLRATLPVKSTDLLLHFGNTNFLARYNIFQSHLSVWEQQYPRLASVDLRYDDEVVLKMAPDAPASASKNSAALAQAAKSSKTKVSPSPRTRARPKTGTAAKPKSRRAATKHALAANKHARRKRR